MIFKMSYVGHFSGWHKIRWRMEDLYIGRVNGSGMDIRI